MDALSAARRPLSLAYGADIVLETEEPRRVIDRIRDRVASKPGGLIRSFRDDGRHLTRTYLWLWEQAGHVAAALASAGAKPGDAVVILVEEVTDFAPAFWGSLLGGFVPVALMNAAREAAFRGDGAFGQALGTLNRPFFLLDEFFAALPLRHAAPPPERSVRLGGIVPAAGVPAYAPPPSDPAYLVATSGSTGKPKLVAVSNGASICRNFAARQKTASWSRDGVGAAPLDTLTGMFPLFAHYDSWTQVPSLLASTKPDVVLDAIEQLDCSTASLNASLVAAIVGKAAQTGRARRLQSLRQVGVGSEPLQPAVLREFAKLLQRGGAQAEALSAGYGATEAGALVTGAQVPLDGDIVEAVNLGRPVAGVSMRVVGESGEVLPEGEIGELEVFAPRKIFSGYWGDSELTAASFTEDGWWRTRDFGRLSNGELSLHGRSKEVLIRNGRKFSLVEMDGAIQGALGPRSVGYACLLPASDDRPEALAVAFDARGTMPEADAAAAIKQAIVRRFGFQPDAIRPLPAEQFPRTPGGKIKRSALSQLVGLAATPQLPSAQEEGKEEPAADLRERLEAIWIDVLALQSDFDPHAGFFDLGGDSLRAVTLHIELLQAFDIHVTSEEFLAAPTFEGLLAHVGRRLAALKGEAPGREDGVWPLAAAIAQPLREALRHWPGEAVTADGLMRGLNAGGNRAPLFWVCNDKNESGSLADALGPSQPLYAMRSGRHVSDYSEDQIQAIALRYVSNIIDLCPAGPLFVGGNCQGGIIALAVAQHLLRRRHHVPLLILMDWSFPLQPFNGRVLFLAGDRNFNLNPRMSYAQPELAWKRVFAEAEFVSIPEGFAQGFNPGIVEVVAAHLRRQMDAALASSPSLLPNSGLRAKIEAAHIETSMAAGRSSRLAVTVRNDSDVVWEGPDVSGIVLGSRWLDHAGRLLRRQEPWSSVPRLEPGTTATVGLDIIAPREAGQYTLALDLREEGNRWFHPTPLHAFCAPVRVTNWLQRVPGAKMLPWFADR